ncbi:MAG: methyltransferase [Flavobacteriaceae bacterium]|nr:methyltransferase [Flavobacteriaceae bacterium]
MSKPPFRFKQFAIAQDRCAMKVGTDGVLLGAWTPISQQPYSILDVGSGTGLIGLMLAQRSGAAQIDGIELDTDAYEQCVENFEATPWNDRLFCYHASFQEFFSEIEEQYDLIVSNPPFYAEQVSSGDQQRDIARQSSSLPFDHLLVGVRQLLEPQQGVFATILPYKEESGFIELAAQLDLYPTQICRVQGNENSAIKRSLIAFSTQKKVLIEESLVLEMERNQYTQAYRELTKDFYLKF